MEETNFKIANHLIASRFQQEKVEATAERMKSMSNNLPAILRTVYDEDKDR